MMDLPNVFVFFLLSCTAVFTVLCGQNVVTDPEVTGFHGHDVTLKCLYGNTGDTITQVEWTGKNQTENEFKIIIFHVNSSVFVHESRLKDRVNFSKVFSQTNDASIIIKDVKKSDQGQYSCVFTTFPSGSYSGKTILKVSEGHPQTTAMTAGIVTAVVLIITFSTALGYFFLLNRRRAVSSSTYYTTQSPDDLQEDVTYADTIILKKGKANKSTSPVEDIEYAAVFFGGRSGSQSLRPSANQQASGVNTAEQETTYAELVEEDTSTPETDSWII